MNIYRKKCVKRWLTASSCSKTEAQPVFFMEQGTNEQAYRPKVNDYRRWPLGDGEGYVPLISSLTR